MEISGFERVRESLRMQQVYNTFFRYGTDMLLDRGALGDFRRVMQRWIYSVPHKVAPLSNPVKTRLMIQELGPTYVKMGQIVSSRSEALPTEWQAELNQLQNNVPPFPIDDVRSIINAELGAPPEGLYESFNSKPLAAASTAQVHRAALPDGQEVVVKIQRPNINNQVKSDLAIMQRAVRVMQRRVSWIKDNDLLGMLNEFGHNVIDELDYRGESYNARKLNRNSEKLPQLRFPIIYSDLSTSKVLTMEFVKGVKVTDIAAMDAAGLDRQAVAETVLRGTIQQVLFDGFFHADPHPGNILVNLDTGAVTFIDTGMVGELNFHQRLGLINLLMVIQQMDVRGLAQVLRSLSVPFKTVDEGAYYSDFEQQVGRYFEPDSTTPFGESMTVVLDVVQNHGMRLDSELTLALKSMMQIEAVFSILWQAPLFVSIANEMVKELVAENVTEEKIKETMTKQAAFIGRELVNRLPTLQDATMKWLKQYEKGRLEIRLDTSDLNESINKTLKVLVQISIGLMLVGVTIGSAIATSVSTFINESWSFLPLIAYAGYVTAMIVSVIMVISLFWRLRRGNV